MRARRRKEVKKRKPAREQVANAPETSAEGGEMTLRALRESLGKTQDQMATLADVTQSQLSKIERRKDHLTSTLRVYVAALGGKLEIVAIVGDRRIPLRDV
jgi:DNA-binding XRE family transcriptional regulator